MKSSCNHWPYTDLGNGVLPALNLLCFGLRDASMMWFLGAEKQLLCEHLD